MSNKKTIDVKEALNKANFNTARGRNASKGREIDLKANPTNTIDDAKKRADSYIEMAGGLKRSVATAHCGVSDKELEGVEFVIEQLEGLARMAFEEVIANY